MLYSLPNRLRPILLLLAPLLAIFAARMATHSEIAARYPRTAALCFLWIAADSLTLALIAKAPRNRPQLRAVLGAIATGFLVATLGAADPVRAALLDMHAVVLAMALTVATYAGWSLWRAIRVFGRTGSIAQAAQQVLPELLVRMAAYEFAMLRLALFSWGAQPDVPAKTQSFSCHRIVNPMIATLLVLQLIEIGVMHLLVSHWSATAAWILFALGVWGLLFTIALMKAFRIYPVLMDENMVRVRAGTLTDFAVPHCEIAGVDAAISMEDTKRSDVLHAAILAHPNIILRLKKPIRHRGLFGKTRTVERVAFRVDEPELFLTALRERI